MKEEGLPTSERPPRNRGGRQNRRIKVEGEDECWGSFESAFFVVLLTVVLTVVGGVLLLLLGRGNTDDHRVVWEMPRPKAAATLDQSNYKDEQRAVDLLPFLRVLAHR